MRITIDEFASRVNQFINDFANTLEKSHHKFALGVALGLIDIKGIAAPLADEEGMVDTDKIKAVLNKGFEYAGDKLVVSPAEFIPAVGMGAFIKQVMSDITTTIRPEDVEKYLN